MPTSVIAIFDIGKTNKKLFLFDEAYNIVLEKSVKLEEVTDEDGEACEDIEALTKWMNECFQEVSSNKQFDIKAVNFSSYGASFVHLGNDGKPITPLYNYLKPFPEDLKKKFYNDYGGEMAFSMFTASPVLGNLNSGMQLYQLKYKQPDLFRRIQTSLHLPQYAAYLFHKQCYSDITSIGCHTNLWNFPLHIYHDWVKAEGVLPKLAPIRSSDGAVPVSLNGKDILCGIGLHDSSAALIPYLVSFPEPFLLLSTGTWCISLNPFTDDPLTVEELEKDCLCYLSYRGNHVKASRLFAGFEHEKQTKRLAEHFHVQEGYYKTVEYMPELAQSTGVDFLKQDDLSTYSSYAEAYTQLIRSLVNLQVSSTKLVLKNTPVKRIFVDGGFSKNPVFMNLLASSFPNIEVYAASMAQASALGAAMAIHQHWNKKPLRSDVLNLKYYTGASTILR
ncbi:MAG TPA: FGGY family carbohydrate kinase [Ohtaekwangia sp.]